MSTPQVSIVMSVYNGERYLQEAIDSVLNQTFTDFEFIIVNDGSTDTTWDILTSYDDPRIRLVRNQENIGLTKSLNKGLALAQGEYIARQDADDISLPERLERQVEFLDHNRYVGLVSSSFIEINEQGEEIRSRSLPVDNDTIQQSLLCYNCFCHGAVVLRKECLEKVGSYREGFASAQDYDLWLRIAEHFNVANIGEPLYKWRVHSRSISVVHKAPQDEFARLAVESAIERRVAGKHKLGDLCAKSLGRYYLWQAIQRYAEDHVTQAHHSLLAGIAYDPSLSKDHGFVTESILTFGQAAYPSLSPCQAAIRLTDKVFASLPAGADGMEAIKSTVLGKCYAMAAFEDYQCGNLARVRRDAIFAYFNDPSWFKNRGVLSILLESFIGPKAMNRVRGITHRLIKRSADG